MAVTEGSSYITDLYYELDEYKLRSIITYFNCSCQRRKTLRTICNDKIEFSGTLMKEQRKERYNFMDAPFDAQFEKIFDSIRI